MDEMKQIKVSRRSPVSGTERTVCIMARPVDYIQWQEGAVIQNVMPYLSAAEREFLISGCTQEEWDSIFTDRGIA